MDALEKKSKNFKRPSSRIVQLGDLLIFPDPVGDDRLKSLPITATGSNCFMAQRGNDYAARTPKDSIIKTKTGYLVGENMEEVYVKHEEIFLQTLDKEDPSACFFADLHVASLEYQKKLPLGK
jgi:hypothetical protein